MKKLLLTTAILSVLLSCNNDNKNASTPAKSSTTEPKGNCRVHEFIKNGRAITKFEYNSKNQISRILEGIATDGSIDEIYEYSYVGDALIEYNPVNNTTFKYKINTKNAIVEDIKAYNDQIDSMFYNYNADNLLTDYTIITKYPSGRRDVLKGFNTFENGNTKENKEFRNDTLINTTTFEYHLDKLDKSNFGTFNTNNIRLFSGFYGSGNKNLIKKFTTNGVSYNFSYNLNPENYIISYTDDIFKSEIKLSYFCD